MGVVEMSVHLPTDEQKEPGCWTHGCCACGGGCIVFIVENFVWLIVLAVVIYAIGWYIQQGMK